MNRTVIICGMVVFLLCVCVEQVSAVNTLRVMDTSVVKGESFDVNVVLQPDGYVKGWELKVSFDMSRLEALSVNSGDFFEEYLTLFNPGVINNTDGRIMDIYGLIVGKTGNISDTGTVVVISFRAKDVVGATEVGLYDAGVTNETMYLPLNVVNGTVLIGASEPQHQQQEQQQMDEDKPFDWMSVFIPVIFFLLVLGIIIKLLIG